jgi:hypothetical protein
MMRGRRLLLVSMGVVVLGVIAALGALYLDPARAAVGPMPGVGLALPAETRSLTGLDVKRFVASPFYQRFGKTAQGRPAAFTELQQRTGIDPEKDVDQVLIGSQRTGTRSGATVVVIGRFDRARLAKAVGAQAGVTTRQHEGMPVYVFKDPRASSALAILSDGAFVMGTQPEVERTVTNHVRGRDGLKGNADLFGLVQAVRTGATFWTVGDQSLLSQMPSAVPAPGGMGGSLTLPGLKSVTVTGDLDPAVSFEAIAQADDAAAASKLADVMRGLIALATLQAAQKPELQQLASALTITTDAARVRINGRLSYELLDALQRTARPATVGAVTAPQTQ